MAGTFISYRRDDAAGYAGRLHEALERRLGAARVFRDVDTIQPGQDFVKAIEARLAACRVMLVIIGREWLDTRNAAGNRRLDDPLDFVRLEVAGGLARPDVLLVPVLVEGASMPAASQLPDNMKALARRNAISVRDETWDTDVDRLIGVVENVAPPAASLDTVTRAITPARSALAAAALAVLLAIALWPKSAANVGDTLPASAGTAPSVEPPARGGGSTAAPYTIDIPRVAEAAFGEVVYSLASGNVVHREQDNELRARIRVTNFGQGALNFWDDSFRLVAGGQTVSPVSGLNTIVGGNSLQYGIITFRFPRQTRQATLQIIIGRNVASIPLDLTPTGRAPVDEQAEIADSMSQAVRESVLNEPASLLRIEGLTVSVDRASTRRFANALRLTLSVRVVNNRTGAFFGGHVVMRVAVGDMLIVPIEWPFGALDRQSTTVESVSFDLPTNATEAVIKTTIDNDSTSFSLRVGR
jgi:hypothetical protein